MYLASIINNNNIMVHVHVSIPLHVVHINVATSLGASKSSTSRVNVFACSKYQWPLVIVQKVLVDLLYYSGLLVGNTEALQVYKGPSKRVYFLPTRDPS